MITITKGPLIFILQKLLSLSFWYNNELLEKPKKTFKIQETYNLIFPKRLKFKVYLKFTSHLQHVNVVQCMWCLKQNCNLYTRN